jgi:hypothetical protein
VSQIVVITTILKPTSVKNVTLLVELVAMVQLLMIVALAQLDNTYTTLVTVLPIAQLDNGKMLKPVNVKTVTLLVLVVPVQTTEIVVVVLNQDISKLDIVLTHVLYPDIIQMILKELVNNVTHNVKNVLELNNVIVEFVTLVLG